MNIFGEYYLYSNVDLTYKKEKIRFCLLHVITSHKGSYIAKLV